MQAITKVFSDIVKPYIDAEDGILQNQLNINGIVNVLPDTFTTQTIGSTTWTKESDGTVVAVKTSSSPSIADLETITLPPGSYRLSGCPSGGSDSMYNMSVGISGGAELARDKGSTALFTLSETTTLIIKARTGASLAVNTQVHFKPMISFAFMDLSYDDYVPYAKSNQQLTKETTGLIENTQVNGAVNIAPFDGTSQLINGVNVTFNADGSITADGANQDKTATANIRLHIGYFTMRKGIGYKVSANKDGSIYSENAGRCIAVRQKSDSSWKMSTDITDNNSAYYTPLADVEMEIILAINTGLNVDNLTFYPMVTVASYNGVYVPYGGKSNKELTEIVTNQLGDATLAGTYLSDCNNVASSGTFNLYGASSSTANSPYTTGVETSANSFVILSRVDTNANWGMQLAIPMTSTKGIYMRFKASGTWGAWSKITP